VADPTTCADALAIVRRYGIDAAAGGAAVLESGAGESVKPGDPRLPRVRDPHDRHAADGAGGRRSGGAAPASALILGDAIEGEARDVGKVLAGIALQVAAARPARRRPACCCPAANHRHRARPGRGGRNVEFLLSLAHGPDGHPRIHALAGDTDGVDGQEEIAGAVLGPDTLARAWAAGIRPRRLADNDGHGFFEALGDSVVTGPTLTNVNDFRAILVEGPAPA
jgi:glycerate 2-kinase